MSFVSQVPVLVMDCTSSGCFQRW